MTIAYSGYSWAASHDVLVALVATGFTCLFAVLSRLVVVRAIAACHTRSKLLRRQSTLLWCSAAGITFIAVTAINCTIEGFANAEDTGVYPALAAISAIVCMAYAVGPDVFSSKPGASSGEGKKQDSIALLGVAFAVPGLLLLANNLDAPEIVRVTTLQSAPDNPLIVWGYPGAAVKVRTPTSGSESIYPLQGGSTQISLPFPAGTTTLTLTAAMRCTTSIRGQSGTYDLEPTINASKSPSEIWWDRFRNVVTMGTGREEPMTITRTIQLPAQCTPL